MYLPNIFTVLLLYLKFVSSNPTQKRDDSGQSYLYWPSESDSDAGTVIVLANECTADPDRMNALNTAFVDAVAMAKAAVGGLNLPVNNRFAQAFVPREDIQNLVPYTIAYSKMASLTMNTINVTCAQINDCTSYDDVAAYTDPDTRPPNINFCDYFFNHMVPCPPILQDCRTNPATERSLSRTNCQGRAFLHEIAHLNGMNIYGIDTTSEDYTYGVLNCKLLAAGDFPDPSKPGQDYPSEYATENADNYAWMAAGVYFNQFCNILSPLT